MSKITDFFEKLFAYDYFGVILFCVIAFLILMFIVILFVGLNDTNDKEEKKQEEIKKDEEEAFLRIDDTVKLDIEKNQMVGFDNDDDTPELPEIKKED